VILPMQTTQQGDLIHSTHNQIIQAIASK
jgi:hypothetical protein